MSRGPSRVAHNGHRRAPSASTPSPSIPGGYRVTAAQARAAGYPDAKSAQADLDRRPARHTYAIEVSYLAPDERPELAADDQLSDDRCRRDRRAPAALGRGGRRVTVDAAVPRADRGQRGGPRSRPRRPPRPGDAAVQAPGAPAQGSRPDHQPRRRLPNFAARARIPGAARHDRPVTDLSNFVRRRRQPHQRRGRGHLTSTPASLDLS